MNDTVLQRFLERQQEDADAFTRSSDLVAVVPLTQSLVGLSEIEAIAGVSDAQSMSYPAHSQDAPPTHYLARFACGGLVRQPDGGVRTANEWLVGFRFPSDYLRRVRPFEIAIFLGPEAAWHPNIAGHKHAICLGHVTPGMSILDLIYQTWSVISWNRFQLADCLNRAAADWARDPANRSRFPVDTRPLKRRVVAPRAVEVPT